MSFNRTSLYKKNTSDKRVRAHTSFKHEMPAKHIQQEFGEQSQFHLRRRVDYAFDRERYCKCQDDFPKAFNQMTKHVFQPNESL